MWLSRSVSRDTHLSSLTGLACDSTMRPAPRGTRCSGGEDRAARRRLPVAPARERGCRRRVWLLRSSKCHGQAPRHGHPTVPVCPPGCLRGGEDADAGTEGCQSIGETQRGDTPVTSDDVNVTATAGQSTYSPGAHPTPQPGRPCAWPDLRAPVLWPWSIRSVHGPDAGRTGRDTRR